MHNSPTTLHETHGSQDDLDACGILHESVDTEGERVRDSTNRVNCGHSARDYQSAIAYEVHGVGRAKSAASQRIQLPFLALQRYLAIDSDRIGARSGLLV